MRRRLPTPRSARQAWLSRLKSIHGSVLVKGGSPAYARGDRLMVVDSRGVWNGCAAREALEDSAATIHMIYRGGVFVAWQEMDEVELAAWCRRLRLRTVQGPVDREHACRRPCSRRVDKKP